MKTKTQKIVISALLAAFVCAATLLVKFSSPLNGYINLGDFVVLLCGWIMPPAYGAMAAGIGSLLADFLSGYALYVPATLVIKGGMALTAGGFFKLLSRQLNFVMGRLLSALAAELIMIFGYFIFEGFLYGFAAAAVNIPANIIQGVFGMLLGTFFMSILDKNKLLDNIERL